MDQQQAPPVPGVADNRDYLDKALDFIEKKIAPTRFNDDPNTMAKNRAMNEKITDAIRKAFEKVTG
ncbi:hypothetical protein MMC12_006921, partial [Toensbergia leucococca]|nr:hypothetical protein [Toensbergia leucococca]